MKFLAVIGLASLLWATTGVGGPAQSPVPKAPPVSRLETLKRRLAKNPQDSKVNLEIGKILLSTGEPKEALRYLRAASANPNKESLTLLAQAYGKSGDAESELRTLESLEKKFEKDPEAQELLARSYARAKNAAKASAHYRKAITLDPKRKSAYVGLLDLFVGLHNNYETRTVLEEMIRRFGKKPDWMAQLCRTFSEDNYFDNAIETCQAAIQLDDKIAENYVYLGKTYKLAQKPEKASEIILKAAKRFPSSELAQIAAGEMNDEQKLWETSVHYYKQCVKAHPKSANCHHKLGNALFELKDYDPALVAYETSCRFSQDVMKDFRRVASILRMQNKSDWAAKYSTSVDRCATTSRQN